MFCIFRALFFVFTLLAYMTNAAPVPTGEGELSSTNNECPTVCESGQAKQIGVQTTKGSVLGPGDTPQEAQRPPSLALQLL